MLKINDLAYILKEAEDMGMVDGEIKIVITNKRYQRHETLVRKRIQNIKSLDSVYSVDK